MRTPSSKIWCFVAMMAMATTVSTAALKPFLSVRTKNGTSVTIYESDGSTPSTKSYFFTPLAILRRDSATREFNAVTKRHEVNFEIDIWNDEFKDEIASLSRILRDSLSIYPADTIKLVSEGLESTKFILSKNDIPFGSRPRTVQFTISCKERKDCGDVVAEIKGSQPNDTETAVTSIRNALNFEVEFRSASGAKSDVNLVSVAAHVIPTVMYREIQQKGGDVLLTEENLKEFTEEVADRFIAGGNQAGVIEVTGSMEFSSPEEALKVIKAGLIEGQVDAATVSDWNKLMWPESDSFYRPDRLNEFLNQAFKTDSTNASLFVVSKPFPELQALNIPKLDAQTRKMLKSQVINWGKSTPAGDFVEWKKTKFRLKPTATFYIVNTANLSKRDNIASVRVDKYPRGAAQRFPVVLSSEIVTPPGVSKKLGSTLSPNDANAVKALENRFNQLQQDMQRQIDNLKLELAKVRQPGPNTVQTSTSGWPTGDYCLFFPRSLTSGSSYNCPDGFSVVHPQKSDFDRGAARFSRGSSKNTNPWLLNFTCCKTMPRDLPTSFNQM